MTLIEVMIAAAIVLMMAGGLISSVIVANQMTYAAAQRQAAFGLCTELLEQMRSVTNFAMVNITNFPSQTLRLTHLGGSKRIPLPCTRDCVVNPLNSPTRKEVQVRVNWTYRGKPMGETLNSVIFFKTQ
jgi:type II secretory pathway pseudopilin PulG